MRRSVLPIAAALGALLAASAPARAGHISWGFDWDRTPVSVTAGSGGVAFTNEPNGLATGNSDVVASNLKVFSSAPTSARDTFAPTAGHYQLLLALTDTASGMVGHLTFSGQLQGRFSLFNANVTNHFTGPLTQTLVLGTKATGFRDYIVTLVSYSPPGPPNQANAGSITAHVDVAPQGGGGPPPHAPEPSSLILGCLGLTFAGGAAWRARRKAAAAV
jgi:hypothetical protein